MEPDPQHSRDALPTASWRARSYIIAAALGLLTVLSISCSAQDLCNGCISEIPGPGAGYVDDHTIWFFPGYSNTSEGTWAAGDFGVQAVIYDEDKRYLTKTEIQYDSHGISMGPNPTTQSCDDLHTSIYWGVPAYYPSGNYWYTVNLIHRACGVIYTTQYFPFLIRNFITEPDIVEIHALDGYVPLTDVAAPVWAKGTGDQGKPVCAPLTRSPLRLQVIVGAPDEYRDQWLQTQCDWSISSNWGAPTVSGSAEPFPGRLGTPEIPIPPSVGDWTLTLHFRIYGSRRGDSPVLLKERTIQLPLFIIYGPPLMPGVDSLLAYCAARLPRGAASPAEVRGSLLSGIYDTRWPYGPDADWHWKHLVANIVAEESQDWIRGNCLAYADLWANLCMVHGVFAESRPIYSAWQLERVSDQQILAIFGRDYQYLGERHPGHSAYFWTKALHALDKPSSSDTWDFSYHQVGTYGSSCYDPVFHLSAPTVADYKKALVDVAIFRDPPLLDEATMGADLATLIDAGQTTVHPPGSDYLYRLAVQHKYLPEFPALRASLSARAGHARTIGIRQTGSPDLAAWTDQIEHDLASPVTVLATVTGTGGGLITGLAPQATLQHDSDSHHLPMYDDGAHGDEAAGDGIYGAVFTNTKAEGTWQACASASGIDQAQPFDLTECVLQGVLVRDLGAHFTGGFSDSGVDEDGLPGSEGCAVTASVNVTGSGEYWLRGTLSKDDTEICYNYAAVPQVSGETAVTLTFPGYLVRSAGMDGPYSAHLVLTEHGFTRIDDADYTTAAYAAVSFQQGTPILDPIGDRRLAEGQLLVIDLRALDPEGDPIVYGLDPLPEGASLDSNTGRFEWPVGYQASGTCLLTFSASDGAAEAEACAAILIDEVPIFSDVPFTGYGPQGSDPFWAYYQVEATWIAGIVQGYEDGLYHPEIAVTRDQMAVFLVRALGQEPTGPADPQSWKDAYGYDPTDPATWAVDFTDVPASGWGEGGGVYWAWFHIQRLYEMGVTQGVTETEYGPTQEVRRDQMAVFLIRALGQECANPCVDTTCWPYDPANPSTWAHEFGDIPATGQATCTGADWAWFHIQALYETGVTLGCGDGTNYCPGDSVRRDEMAVFLARAFLGM